MKAHNFYRFIIDLLYPNICPSCGVRIDYNGDFCDSCREKLIPYCGDYPIENADETAFFCEYTKEVKAVTLKFKKDPCGNTYYAYAKGIAAALAEKKLSDRIDLILFVPMTAADKRKRGYNQTELIAKELCYILEKPCLNALVKVRETRSQKSLSENERRENVKNAFSVRSPEQLKSKNVLVIDDVCTTGSTLSEAARAIKAAGADKVYASAFAKTAGIAEKADKSEENAVN
ncbi:MAG: ComF family protein, partial [Ruminiclostridium sp.]